MTFQSQIKPEKALTIPNALAPEFSAGYQAPSLTAPTTLDQVHSALFAMKGANFIQEHKQDDATIGILSEILLAYQLELVVRRFIKSDECYPTPSIINRIIGDLVDEGVFTNVDSLR